MYRCVYIIIRDLDDDDVGKSADHWHEHGINCDYELHTITTHNDVSLRLALYALEYKTE